MLSKNSIKSVLVLCVVLLSGCLDGSEKTRVGSSDYFFVNLGGYQRFLVNSENLIVVPPTVLDYVKYEGGFIFVRQITEEFTCGSGSLRAAISDEFEYWYLYKDDSYSLSGPFQKEALKSSVGERVGSKGWWEALDSKIDAVENGDAFQPSGNDCS